MRKQATGSMVQQMVKSVKTSAAVSAQKPKMLPPLTKAHVIAAPKSKK